MAMYFVARSMLKKGKYTGLYGLTLSDLISTTFSLAALHVLVNNEALPASGVLILISLILIVLSVSTLNRKLEQSRNFATDIVNEYIADMQSSNPTLSRNQKEEVVRRKPRMMTPLFMVP